MVSMPVNDRAADTMSCMGQLARLNPEPGPPGEWRLTAAWPVSTGVASGWPRPGWHVTVKQHCCTTDGYSHPLAFPLSRPFTSLAHAGESG